MDRAETDRLIVRLVKNPHDETALEMAHRGGESDPEGYAALLERVASETRDAPYAAHWFTEAAEVWLTALTDPHRAARLLMSAIDKDPTSESAADKLAGLYREKGDLRALVALLDRRARALGPLIVHQPELRSELAGMHEELGRLWSEAPLSQPKKAIEHYRKAMDLDPSSAYAIYNLRELYKQGQDWLSAIPLYAAELVLESDPARRVGLYRDEAATCKRAGDLKGATRALVHAREIDADDHALQQEYASSVLERLQAGENVTGEERDYAASLLVGLAKTYEGDHGLAYATAALDLRSGDDRAFQLYLLYARALGRETEVRSRASAYLEARPTGTFAVEARAAASPAPASPPASPPASQSEKAPTPLETRKAEKPKEALESRASAQAPERIQGLLDEAQRLLLSGNKPGALAAYTEVLDSDPARPEALAWTEEYLRSRREYSALRDVLIASIRATANVAETMEARKERLREIAGLSEGNLRDLEGAASAWRQLLALDRGDESARTALMRLLEKGQRWAELAGVIEQEATIESDIDTKILLERKLARLQEDKRQDLVGAGEAWSRIARLQPDDDHAVLTASRLFERGGRTDLATEILAEAAPALEDPVARGQLWQRLGELREQGGEIAPAAEAYAEAAEALRSAKLWEEADRLFSQASAWGKAAHAAYQRGTLISDLKQHASLLARSADYLTRAGEYELAVERLEEATDLDPLNDDYAGHLVSRYRASEQVEKLVAYLARRGERITDRTKRIAIRREAANLANSRHADRDLLRDLWLKLLEDGDDREALEHLIDDAVGRGDHGEAATLLRRLGQNTSDKSERARFALREAKLLAEGVGDIETAISRYEVILADLDPTCRPALQAVALLQEGRGSFPEAAEALERELRLVADVQERGEIAARLARLYETLDDPRSAIRALDLVRKAEPEDVTALRRLCELCEVTEQWGRVAELLVERIEMEGDPDETVTLTAKLASILADKLDRGDEALGALTDLADQGEPSIRKAYVELGDRLGWKGIVASKLKEWWFDARHGTERTGALRGAFERFADVGRDTDAVGVAIELVRTKGADRKLSEQLEVLAVKTGDHDALAVAHEVLSRETSGAERARELVRQAEVRVRAGTSRDDALSHGEHGLHYISPSEAEPLLERLANLAAKGSDVVDLYERQVTRSKQASDRMRALARAAQVASLRGQPERARGFFEMALVGAPTEETVSLLEQSAREGDRLGGGDRMRRSLAQALASSGHGARDGGKTRASLLRRASSLAHGELGDVDQAFACLADALVAHVDQGTLDMLESLGLDLGDPRRAEAALTHALGEVFDGPMVRQLLARRAKIRREQLVEPGNAATDLKRLHDLAPNDQAVMDELSELLMDLADYKQLIQLYEDQILRAKEIVVRAELARRIARVWEEQLSDAREATDAWRRVLRLKPGDAEAEQGVERAKASRLKRPAEGGLTSYAPPPLVVAPVVHGPAEVTSAPAPLALEPRPSTEPSQAEQAEQAESDASSGGSETPASLEPFSSEEASAPATTLRGLGVGANGHISFDSEIDRSLDRLEHGGREADPATATHVPGPLAATEGEDEVSLSDVLEDDDIVIEPS